MKNKWFLEKTCCGNGADRIYTNGDPCGGSRTQVRALVSRSKLGGFHHGEEEEEDEEGELISRNRCASFKTGASDRDADAASARRLPINRAGPAPALLLLNFDVV